MSRTEIEQLAFDAQRAGRKLACLSIAARNHILQCMHDSLKSRQEEIAKANRLDVDAAKDSSATNQALIKRLNLTAEKYESLLSGIDAVISLADPVGVKTMDREITPGLELTRVTCPIGVLCIIYEARPEAGVQIASLAVKSGNALILKGGKEASHSNRAVYEALVAGLHMARDTIKTGECIPTDCIQLVDTRDEISALLALDQYIDLVIPRGSNSLVRSVKAQTKIPVLGHADGICSIYVDDEVADLDQAVKIIVDSKTNYPAACNAMETLLVHSTVCEKLLPKLAEACASFNMKYEADPRSINFLPSHSCVPATDASYRTEFLDLKMAVKVVDSIDEAVEHINGHGSHHTDCILTKSCSKITLFTNAVDSASVYSNCSTRFADGFRYGFGAEVGIATSKIHSRGPVGVEGLLIYKYKMIGSNQTVGEMGKTMQYTHKDLLHV